MEYSRSFALLAYVISVYYRFSAYTQIDLCTAFRTIAHFRFSWRAIQRVKSSNKNHSYLESWICFFASLSRVSTLYLSIFTNLILCFFSFFLGTISKIELLEDQIEYMCFGVADWSHKMWTCAFYVLYTLWFSWVEFSSVESYSTAATATAAAVPFYMAGKVSVSSGVHYGLVAWYTWYTHSLYVCTVCAFIRKIEAYTDILSRIKPEEEKTPH